MGHARREKFKEKMGEKKEAREEEIKQFASSRRGDGIYDNPSLPKRVIRIPYKMTAAGCRLVWNTVSNKYVAGAVALSIAFGGGVIYGVNNAESIREDYSKAIDVTTEFVQDTLTDFEAEKEKTTPYTTIEEKLSTPYQNDQSKLENTVPNETVVKENKTEDLEGVATEADPEEQY